jgi:hypothetical protein
VSSTLSIDFRFFVAMTWPSILLASMDSNLDLLADRFLGTSKEGRLRHDLRCLDDDVVEWLSLGI